MQACGDPTDYCVWCWVAAVKSQQNGLACCIIFFALLFWIQVDDFHRHQMMWHSFIPNTLPSPQQNKYPAWFFFLIEIWLFSKCSSFFYLFFWAVYYIDETVKCLTTVTVVIYQDDLLQQVCRGVVDHTVDGAQDHRQSLIHKDEDHWDLREVLWVRQLLTPDEINTQLLVSIKSTLYQLQFKALYEDFSWNSWVDIL